MTFIIYNYGEEINRIEADEAFTRQYCEDNGYTYSLPPEPEPGPEPEPTPSEQDKLEAQVLYTAMMTDTLLEG